MVVVLPAPFGPNKPTICPDGMETLMSSTARNAPKVRDTCDNSIIGRASGDYRFFHKNRARKIEVTALNKGCRHERCICSTLTALQPSFTIIRRSKMHLSEERACFGGRFRRRCPQPSPLAASSQHAYDMRHEKVCSLRDYRKPRQTVSAGLSLYIPSSGLRTPRLFRTAT